jgi:hypothetical protein
MSRRKILLISLGGTITMTRSPKAGGNTGLRQPLPAQLYDRHDVFVVESALTHQLLAAVGAIFSETNGSPGALRWPPRIAKSSRPVSTAAG